MGKNILKRKKLTLAPVAMVLFGITFLSLGGFFEFKFADHDYSVPAKIKIAEAAKQGTTKLYFRTTRSDYNNLYGTLSLTPSPNYNAYYSGSTSTVNANGNPPTAMCTNAGSTPEISNWDILGSTAVSNRCVDSFISQPVGTSFSLATSDTSALSGQIYTSESSATVVVAPKVHLYKLCAAAGGDCATSGSLVRFKTFTLGDPGTSMTSQPIAAAAPDVATTLLAADRIVAVVTMNITTKVSSSNVNFYYDNSMDSPAAGITIKYTLIPANKPSLPGPMDDDFNVATTTAGGTACSTAGVAYNTKWKCLNGTAANAGGYMNAEDLSGTGNGDSSSWMWVRNQFSTAGGGTPSNFGTSPSNTFLYQTLPSGYGDGIFQTVVNSTTDYTIGVDYPASPYSHSSVALWTSNTDYLEVQLYSTADHNSTNTVFVALNNKGALSGATSLNPTATSGKYSQIWLGFAVTGGSYQAKYSLDGSTYSNVGSPVSHANFTRVGLNSYTGIVDMPGLAYTGAFEWFKSTVTAATISATPANISVNSAGNTVNLTGTGTAWTAGTPGTPTFTLSGGTGASITSQTVTDATHATLTINAGSSGSLTIYDPSSGASVTVNVMSNQAQVNTFNLASPVVTGAVNNTDHTVGLAVPPGTNVTSLIPTITLSAGATISPVSGSAQNFTAPVTYTVTAQDGVTTQQYIVSVAGWQYRQPFTLTNNVAQTLSGFQVKLTVDTAALYAAGKLQAGGGDLRFTEADGATNIPYWVRTGINTNATEIWIKTGFASSEVKNIYMYYGNSAAVSASSGYDVFEFFDDFENIAVGTLGSWTKVVTGGPYNGGTSASVVTDSITGSHTMETNANQSGAWATGYVHTSMSGLNIAAGNYTYDFGLYTMYGHSMDAYSKASVLLNGTEVYSNLGTSGSVWEQRTFTYTSAVTTTSLNIGQWAYLNTASPVYRYEDLRIRKAVASEPTSAAGSEQVLDAIAVGSTGIQNASLSVGATNAFVGGAFTLARDNGIANVTVIKVTLGGTVVASDIANLKLYTDTATNCTTTSFSSGQYGSTITAPSIAANTFTGTVAVGTAPVCIYVVTDVSTGAGSGHTLEISVDASSDVTVSAGSIAGTFPVQVSGSTVFSGSQSLSFSISGGTVGFGTMSSSASVYANAAGTGSATEVEAHTITASSSASGGYAVTVKGPTLASGGNTITAIGGTNTVPNPGNKQFGLRLNINSGNGTVTSPYSTAGQFAYAGTASTASQVVSGAGNGSSTVFSVRYLSNISPVTAAGSYSTNLVYVATATF